jgi:hypothetical protein
VKGNGTKVDYKVNTSTLIILTRTIARNTGVGLIHVCVDA